METELLDTEIKKDIEETASSIPNELLIKAHQLLIEKELSFEITVKRLVRDGYSHEDSTIACQQIIAHFNKNKKSGSTLKIVIGSILFIGGIVATTATDGHTVFYGAVIVGAIQLITGIVKAVS